MPLTDRVDFSLRRLNRLHWAAVVLVGVVTISCGFYWSRLNAANAEFRGATIAQTEQRTLLLADALGTQTDILVDLVDFALQHLRDDLQSGSRASYDSAVASVLKTFPAIARAQVSVVDASGHVSYSTLGGAARAFVGDREHFKRHAAATSDDLAISKPLQGKVSKEWSIYFSRPLREHGRFAGIIVVSLSPEYLARNLAIHGLGPHDVITLFDVDGNFLSRNTDLAGAMGKSVPPGRPFVGLRAPIHGTFRAVASFDAIPRVFAWRRVQDHPLVALVGIDERDVLGPVDAAIEREQRQNLAGIALVLLLTLGMATLLIQVARRQLALAHSEELYRTLFEAADEAIVVTDAHNFILAVNPAFTAITGYAAAEVVGKNPSVLASGQHNEAFYQTMWQHLASNGRWAGEIYNRRKDGSFFIEWLRVSVIVDERKHPRRYVALFNDITERKNRDEIVWRQANFDALTGLPNRRLLEDRLEMAITKTKRSHAELALLFIDLDRFKPVNDGYGHAVGDELLRQVASRLTDALRDEDTVARLGGDEFVVLLPEVNHALAPEHVAGKLVAALSAPFTVGMHTLSVSCSIGIALYPRDADNAFALVKKADVAMYAAKAAGRSTWVAA